MAFAIVRYTDRQAGKRWAELSVFEMEIVRFRMRPKTGQAEAR